MNGWKIDENGKMNLSPNYVSINSKCEESPRWENTAKNLTQSSTPGKSFIFSSVNFYLPNKKKDCKQP